MVQLSHSYTTTGKSIAVIRWTFVGKVMSVFFNMLSRFVKFRLKLKKVGETTKPFTYDLIKSLMVIQRK